MDKKLVITAEDCRPRPRKLSPKTPDTSVVDNQIKFWQEKFTKNISRAHQNQFSVPAGSPAFAAQPPEWHQSYLSGDGRELNFVFSAAVIADFMKTCADPKLREEVYDLYRAPYRPKTHGSNVNIGQKIINLRQIRAKNLGYENHADYTAVGNYITVPATVKKFLIASREHLTPIYQKNYRLLAEYARTQLGIKNMRPADAYYVLHHLATAPSPARRPVFENYFPERHVTSQLIKHVEKLFDLKFVSAGKTKTGTRYRIYDQQNKEILAAVEIDLWAQPGQAADFVDETFASYEVRSGKSKKLKLPEIKITCDFKETATGHRELDFQDLVDLFHEMGHLVETLFTIRNEQNKGALRFENDLVEFYSLFMENFIYDEGFVRQLSSPARTGKHLPRREYQEACRMQKFIKSFTLMEILEHSLKEFEFYGPGTESLAARERRLQKELYEGQEIFNDNIFYDPTAHIFTHDPEMAHYAGNYYTYLLSEVVAQAIFEKFKARNPKLLPEKDPALRNKIYSQQGLRPFFAASCDYLAQDHLTLNISQGYHALAPTGLNSLYSVPEKLSLTKERGN